MGKFFPRLYALLAMGCANSKTTTAHSAVAKPAASPGALLGKTGGNDEKIDQRQVDKETTAQANLDQVEQPQGDKETTTRANPEKVEQPQIDKETTAQANLDQVEQPQVEKETAAQ